MVFPQDPLEPTIELQVAGVWTDITDYVYLRDEITIERGRQDEGSAVDSAKCSLTLNNRDGRFSPRNPTSPYYGDIGRNTPIRVSVPYGDVALTVPGGSGDKATCPDAAALDLTGDLDIRIDLTADDWGSGGALAGKYAVTGHQRSWALNVGSEDQLQFIWSTDGTLTNRKVAESTEAIPQAPGRRALRATLDVDNGSGGYTVRFYTADTIDGTWTQLGDAVTVTGTTSVYASTAQIEVGDIADLDGSGFAGRYHAFQLLDGIGGTSVANPDFTTQTAGAASFVDTAASPSTWTVQGGALIDARTYRFAGEVSSWPARWDVSGQDVYVPLEAAGILRRLGQGRKALRSALYREISGLETPYTAWWPLEDSAGSTQAAAGYTTHGPLAVSGEVTFAADSSGGVGGGVSTGATGRLIGTVPSGPTGWIVAAWYTPPAPTEWDALHLTPLLQWQTPGSTGAAYWDFYGGWDGTQVQVFCEVADSSTTVIGGAGGPASALVGGGGLPVQMLVYAVQDGSDIDVTVQVDGATIGTGTITGATLASITSVGINARTVNDSGATFLGSWAHLLVADSARLTDVTGHIDAGQGYAGEDALTRATRVAAEEDIPFTTVGDTSTSQLMGPQGIATALDLIAECADADLGLLYERLTPTGLALRSRASDYNSATALTLDYTAGDIAPPLEPVDDDQALRNDVTISRPGGSSARLVDETSPLSVNPPPDGVGRYDEQLELNLYADYMLEQVAGWRLYLGTRDAARYPRIHLDLAAAPHLIDDVMGMDLRSRLQLTGLPAWLPPGPEDLLIEGYTETIGVYDWDLELNCSPGEPWNVATADHATYGRADTDGSELAAAVDADDTTLSVSVTQGPLWTTDPAHVPLDIQCGGEVMTVTAITGTSSPQTFTVTRSTNGISKPHTAGSAVSLAYPAIVAL